MLALRLEIEEESLTVDLHVIAARFVMVQILASAKSTGSHVRSRKNQSFDLFHSPSRQSSQPLWLC